MITADALHARAAKLEGEPFFKSGEASELAFEITAHPAMPEHVSRCKARGLVFQEIYKALHKGDANAAGIVVEQVFPGFAWSTVARADADGAGILPDDSDDLRFEGVCAAYPPGTWTAPDARHVDVTLPRANADTGACRVSIAVVIAVLYALELRDKS